MDTQDKRDIKDQLDEATMAELAPVCRFRWRNVYAGGPGPWQYCDKAATWAVTWRCCKKIQFVCDGHIWGGPGRSHVTVSRCCGHSYRGENPFSSMVRL